jgi:hypothetical protein
MSTPQEPYGQQAYGPPPGYGPPPPAGYGGYGPPGYPPYGYRAPTNTMAILSLVFAFVFAPVGLGLGIAARRQIARTREEGDGLALAGVIVGSIVTGIWVLVIIFWIIALATIPGTATF